MSLYEITFSPTGGTQRVSQILSSAMGGADQLVDLTDRAADFSALALTDTDVCIVAVPSFAGRVPAPAAGRLRSIRGGNALAVAVVVYGNRTYDDTMLELTDLLGEASFRTVAAVAAVAEHSILRQFATGRPDADDVRELTSFAEKIRTRLASGDLPSPPAVPGNRPYRALGPGVKPVTGEACLSCGVCADMCPVGAIPADNPSDIDKDVCFSCMRCISVCPVGAKVLAPEVLAALTGRIGPHLAGYRRNELFLG